MLTYADLCLQVIGTPGRLQHTLLKSPEFNAKKLELLILDEADRLLDMGFQHSLNRSILSQPIRTYAYAHACSRMLTYGWFAANGVLDMGLEE
jgi:hypothetical protein